MGASYQLPVFDGTAFPKHCGTCLHTLNEAVGSMAGSCQLTVFDGISFHHSGSPACGDESISTMAGSCQLMPFHDVLIHNNPLPACRDESIDNMAAIYRQMEALTGGQWAAVSAVWCRVTSPLPSHSSNDTCPAVAASFMPQTGVHSEICPPLQGSRCCAPSLPFRSWAMHLRGRRLCRQPLLRHRRWGLQRSAQSSQGQPWHWVTHARESQQAVDPRLRLVQLRCRGAATRQLTSSCQLALLVPRLLPGLAQAQLLLRCHTEQPCSGQEQTMRQQQWLTTAHLGSSKPPALRSMSGAC